MVTLSYSGTNNITADRLHDGSGRLPRLAWDQVSNTLPDFSYDFDSASNILTKTHEHRASNKTEDYDYDDLYRLTKALYDFRTVTHGFVYDDLGNQLTLTSNASTSPYLYNEVNELTSDGESNEVYYDKNGNVTRDSVRSFYYDRDNKLTRVYNDSTQSLHGEYSYDALGRRIEFIDGYNSVTKRYYHDNQRVIEEYNAAGTPARQRCYIWGNYIDELLLMNDDGGDNSDYMVCHDQLYSASALLSKANGAIVERYDYDAYGLPGIYTATASTPDGDWWDGDESSANSSAKGLVYLFTGREFDTFAGTLLYLQYSRARTYNHTLRRWMQRDPDGYVDGMNLYQYVRGNPIVYSDASGLAAPPCPRVGVTLKM